MRIGKLILTAALAAAFLTTTAHAALSPAQIAILHTDIINTPAFNSIPAGPEGAQAIADIYNAAASPSFIVWRTSVNASFIMSAANWDWTRVDNLSVGKARIWEWMTRAGSSTGAMIDFSKCNIRTSVETTFSVESSDAPNRQASYDQGSRPATRLEKLFAVAQGNTACGSGNGAAPSAHGTMCGSPGACIGPALLGYEGSVTYQEVQTARGF